MVTDYCIEKISLLLSKDVDSMFTVYSDNYIVIWELIIYRKGSIDMKKSNQSFNWYGLKQRFSIRKYHFGAASVLIGTSLVFAGAPTAHANEQKVTDSNSIVLEEKSDSNDSKIKLEKTATSQLEETVQTDSTNKKIISEIPAVISKESPKLEEHKEVVSEEKTTKEVEPTEEVTKETVDTTSLAKEIQLLDSLFVKLAGKELTQSQQEKIVKAAEVLNQAKDVVVTVKSTQEVVHITNEITKVRVELERVLIVNAQDDIVDSVKDNNKTVSLLEKTVLEAGIINDTAKTYATKIVKDEKAKSEIIKAIDEAKEEIKKSKEILNSKDISAEELAKKKLVLDKKIEQVTNTMKAAGHADKIEAVLSDESVESSPAIVAPRTKIPVQNLDHLTEEEIAAIKHEIMNTNPSITDPSMIRVEASGRGVTGNVVVTVNGVETRIISGDVIVGTSGTKNLEQLKYSINWFDFASSTITYPDGTVVGEARKLAQPITRTLTYPNGDQVEGKITMVRDVTYTDGTKGLTTDEKFLNSGITRYVEHLYGDGNAQNNHELYEVLQEGMKFNVKTKVKGYVLTATVMKLAPKDVKTDPKRTEAGPINSLRQDAGGPLITKVGNDRRADILLTAQDKQWSYLRKAGFQTTNPDGSEMLTAFSSSRDMANVGVTFALSATYNSRPVDVNVIAADAEEANNGEVVQFVTDGTKWKSFMEANQKRHIDSGTARPSVPMNENQLSANFGLTHAGYNPKEWVNLDENGNPTVYGTHVFGPNKTSQSEVHSLPIAFSQNVKTLSLYLNSFGAQAGTFGFMIYDGGDAPESYGEAFHAIGDFNKEKNGQQVTATQPYLGDQPGDPDFRSTASDPSGLWLLDDLVHTEKYEEIGVKIGDKISNGLGDTGTLDKVDGVWVIRKSSVETIALKQGDIVSINKPKEGKNTDNLDDIPVRGLFNAASQSVSVGALPDEGEAQLIDGKTGIREYTLRQATDSEYVLEGIKVHRGVNNDSAYVRAWVDFNNNGKFDQFESSEVLHVQEDGTVNISFKNTPQLLTTSIDSIGVRVRIGLDEKEILSPTGIASSGEVEDFLTHVVHFPRGIRNFSKGYQGQKQEVNIPTNAMFAAQGKTKDSNYKDWNQIETTIAPKFVITESSVVSTEETGKDVNITLNGTTVYGGKE